MNVTPITVTWSWTSTPLWKTVKVAALNQLAVGVELRRVEHDVVGLPLAGLPARVHERRVLLVNGARLAVEVGRVLVRVEDLQLVVVHQEHAAVAAALAAALDDRRRGELDVELAAAERLLRLDAAAAGLDGRDAVGDDPRRRPAGGGLADPLREVLAVEEHDRVRWRRTRSGARRHHGRLFRGIGHLPRHALLRVGHSGQQKSGAGEHSPRDRQRHRRSSGARL